MIASNSSGLNTAEANALRSQILKAAILAALGGALFILAIASFSGLREFYGTESTQETIDLLDAKGGEIYAAWSIMAIGDLLVGIGIWLISRVVARIETGRLATIALVGGRVALVACTASALIRAYPPGWFTSAEDVASVQTALPFVALVFLIWGAYSAAYIAIGVVLVKGQTWPTWLGIAMIVLAIPPLVMFLPLFYAVGAILLGVVLLLRRAPTPEPSRVSS